MLDDLCVEAFEAYVGVAALLGVDRRGKRARGQKCCGQPAFNAGSGRKRIEDWTRDVVPTTDGPMKEPHMRPRLHAQRGTSWPPSLATRSDATVQAGWIAAASIDFAGFRVEAALSEVVFRTCSFDRVLRVRFGLHGRVGVVRLMVGEAAPTGSLPECAPGDIAMGVEESDAGAAYLLVIPALGAGA